MARPFICYPSCAPVGICFATWQLVPILWCQLRCSSGGRCQKTWCSCDSLLHNTGTLVTLFFILGACTGAVQPERKVNVMHRPPRQSKKNEEQLEKAHERDVAEFERRANVYRKLAGQPCHHNRVRKPVSWPSWSRAVVERAGWCSEVIEHVSTSIRAPQSTIG